MDGFGGSIQKPVEPRKLTHGKPTKAYKRVIITVTKDKVEDKMGCYLGHLDTEMEQKRPVIIAELAKDMHLEKAGAWPNDVFVSINGHEVETPTGAGELFRRAAPKIPFQIVVFRPPPHELWITRHEQWMVAAAVATPAMMYHRKYDPNRQFVEYDRDGETRQVDPILWPLIPLVTIVIIGILYYLRKSRDVGMYRQSAFKTLVSASASDARKLLHVHAAASGASKVRPTSPRSPMLTIADGPNKDNEGTGDEDAAAATKAAATADKAPATAVKTPKQKEDERLLRMLVKKYQMQQGVDDPQTRGAAGKLADYLVKLGEVDEASRIRDHFGLGASEAAANEDDAPNGAADTVKEQEGTTPDVGDTHEENMEEEHGHSHKEVDHEHGHAGGDCCGHEDGHEAHEEHAGGCCGHDHGHEDHVHEHS